MLSPGSGAGNKAAAAARIKGFLGPLLEAATAFEPGTKENQAIINAYRALTPVFGKADHNSPNMVPAALQALSAQGHKGPLSAAPPPGLMATNKPPSDMPMPPMGGEAEAA
jgi:hypothetical protein